MDRVPLIVVATGVVVLVLVVFFAVVAPWGPHDGAQVARAGPVDAAGLIASVTAAEPDWRCERSTDSAPVDGAVVAWEQTWLADGVRLMLSVQQHSGAGEARAAWERFIALIPQPRGKDHWGAGWASTTFGTPRGPAAVALHAGGVAALVRAEPVDPKKADSTRSRAERMAELVRIFVLGGGS